MTPDSSKISEGTEAPDKSAIPDQALWLRLSAAETPERFVAVWLEIQAQIIGGVTNGVVVMGAPDKGPYSPIAFWPKNSDISVELSAAAELAMTERQGVVREYVAITGSDEEDKRNAISYPILVDDQLCGVAAFEIELKPQENLRAAMRQLQWGIAWLENLVRRKTLTPRDRLVMVLEIVASSFEHERFQAAAIAVVTELATTLGCEWVAYASLRGKHAVLRALSHSANVGQTTNLVRAVGAAMNEALDQHDVVVFPPLQAEELQVTRAHEQLSVETGGGDFCTIPLSDRGRLCGAITLKLSTERKFTIDDVETCKHLGAIVGPVLEIKRREDRWLIQKAWESFVQFSFRLIGPRHAGLKIFVTGIIALGIFFARAEGDYLISADATLEGTVQRSITALMDGYIANARRQAGDTVKKGEVLGRLEDKDLKLEQFRWVSQREQRTYELRRAEAGKDRAQAQILKAQIHQTEARIAFIAKQLERVGIVAPFDGIIINGDLSQMLGAPVERGQVLFEIAPLNSYRVVLKVDETEISRVSNGQVGQLALAGLPDTPLDFRVQKITPISTAEDGRNYFRVEARLVGNLDLLRPGMEGVGKIFVEKRKLIWIWTYKFQHWLRFWIWNWWPTIELK